VQHFFFVFVRYVLLTRLRTVPSPFVFYLFDTFIPRLSRVRTSGFENSRVLPKNKIRHSDPSIDGTIEIVRRFQQVFEAYRMVFKEMKEKISHSNDNVYAK